MHYYYISAIIIRNSTSSDNNSQFGENRNGRSYRMIRKYPHA